MSGLRQVGCDALEKLGRRRRGGGRRPRKCKQIAPERVKKELSIVLVKAGNKRSKFDRVVQLMVGLGTGSGNDIEAKKAPTLPVVTLVTL